MSRNRTVTSGTEDFFADLAKVFDEAKEKGLTKRNEYNYTRTQIINFLIACGGTTLARARATNPVTLPDGSIPSTVFNNPPGVLKIGDKERRRLEKCGNTVKFIAELQSIHSRQNGQRNSSMQPAKRVTKPQGTTSRKIKIRVPSSYTDEASSSLPTAQQEGISPPRAEELLSIPEAEMKVDRPPSPELSPCRSSDLKTNVDSPGNVDSAGPIREAGLGECTHGSNGGNRGNRAATPTSDTVQDIMAMRAFNQQFACPSETDADSGDDTESEQDVGEDTSLLGDPGADVICNNRDNGSNERGNTTMSAGIVDKLKELAAEIPGPAWTAYEKKLRRLCESPRFRAMDTTQRLRRISSIVYLGEEEATMTCGGWSRLENAVHMCAVLAVETGFENGVKAHEVVEKWVHSKLRDIGWLQMMLSMGARARNSQDQHQA